MKTKVIFRKFIDCEEIIALFPHILGSNDPYDCQSYMHHGQHGAAYPDNVIACSTPTREWEYADLKKELEKIGYDLEIQKRYRRADLQCRINQLKKSLTSA